MIDQNLLDDAGVVFIGNAWRSFTQEELNTLHNYLSQGGGLFLMGLGWSWEPYNPGSTLSEYPMNKIGEFCGIRWIDGSINDTKNNYNGSPLFLAFYPSIQIQTISGAIGYLDSTTANHASDLYSVLQSDEELRSKYTNAILYLKKATAELNVSDYQLESINTFYLDLVKNYPNYFQKDIIYDCNSENGIAWIRELLFKSIQDAIPLTQYRKNEIASAIGLNGRYLDIWNDFSVMLLDNSSLNESQKNFIYQY